MKRENGIWWIKVSGKWEWCVSLSHAVQMLKVVKHEK